MKRIASQCSCIHRWNRPDRSADRDDALDWSIEAAAAELIRDGRSDLAAALLMWAAWRDELKRRKPGIDVSAG